MKNVFVSPEEQAPAQRLLATVVGINGRTTLRFDGEDVPRAKTYRRLASYTPSMGDRVYVVPISGTYLIIGKVV